MIQVNVNADTSLPGMAVGALPAGTGVSGPGEPAGFPGLLGLLVKSQFSALPAQNVEAFLAQAPFEAAGLGQGEGGMAQSGETLLGQLLAQLLGAVQLSGGELRPGLGQAKGGLDPSGLAGAPAQGQKKLPASPAALAGLLASIQQEGADTDLTAFLPKSARELLAKELGGLSLKFAGDAPFNGPRAPPSGAMMPESGTTTAAVSHGFTVQPAILREMDPSAVARLPVNMTMPLTSPEWRAELGDRIAWMVGRHAQVAELVLNPPSLGTIEVRLQMNLAGNEAGAQFFSNNPAVRDALESAFPRLKELLADAGIALGNTTVSQQSFSGGQNQGGQQDAAASAQAFMLFPGAESMTSAGARSLSGLVDLYI